MRKILFATLLMLFAAEANAVTWYVRVGGTGANCTQYQTSTTAAPNIPAALACVGTTQGDGANDVVEVWAGTYTGFLQYIDGGTRFPSGTSWAAPFTFRAKSGDTVTLRGTSTGILQLSSSFPQYAIVEGFIFDGVNSTGSASVHSSDCCIPSRYLRFQNNTITNNSTNGMLGDGDHIEILNNTITKGTGEFGDDGTSCGQIHCWGYPLYFSGSNSIISGNTFHDFPSWGIHFNGGGPYPSKNIVSRNRFYNYGEGDERSCAITLNNGDDNLITRNEIFNSSSSGICNGTYAYRNIIYNNSIHSVTLDGIYIDPNAGGLTTVAKNNIVSNASRTPITATATRSHNLCNAAGTGCDIVGNPLFVSSTDLNLQAGSAAINVGIASIAPLPAPLSGTITVPYNGAAPDIGAFETWGIANCNVGDVAANKLRCNVANNVAPPVLAPSATGWSPLEAGGAKAFTGPVVLGGGSVLEFTTTINYGSGTSCDLTYATTGTASDSSLVGNSHNQRLNAVTSTPCTNTVSGPSASVATQTHGRIRNLYGAEVAVVSDWKAAVDTAYTIIPGGAARVRIKAKATTADPAAFNPTLQYDLNSSGSWSTWTDTCSASTVVCAVGAGMALGVTNTTPTTEQLTSDLSTNVACAVVLTSSAVPLIDLSQDSETECEYGIKVDSSVAVGTTIRFRMIKDGATPFDTYTVYPTLTVVNPGIQQA